MSERPLRLAHAPAAARRMARAAREFVESLTPAQRAAALFPFEGDERFVWHYTPVERNGLSLKDMTDRQVRAAHALMAAGLSRRGACQAQQIMALETALREWERLQGRSSYVLRDPELYFFSVFGDAAGVEPWGWRVNGHHLALHFTIVAAEFVAPVPLFFGANPAEVRHGPGKGARYLVEEEQLARRLLLELDPAQRVVAVVDAVAPSDIVSRNRPVVTPDTPARGLAFAAMQGAQREKLVVLIQHYLKRSAPDLADNEWDKIEAAGLESVTFAWAGSSQPGQGHYYAIAGPGFMLEYDNTQNGANHIHSVWRDFTGDYGVDLLARHYAESHT